MKRQQYDLYVAFFNMIMQFSDMVSFKAIVFDTEGTRRPIDEIVSELHSQLVHMGIKHEVTTGRAGLPRLVNFTKDKEIGNDAITLQKIQQHLEMQFKVHYEEQLRLSMFGATDSWGSIHLQVADLFAGSINRILNESHNNHKDEFAQHVIAVLGINPEDIFNTDSDMVKIILLN